MEVVNASRLLELQHQIPARDARDFPALADKRETGHQRILRHGHGVAWANGPPEFRECHATIVAPVRSIMGSMRNFAALVALVGSLSPALRAQAALAPDVEAGRKRNLAFIQVTELAGSIATDRDNCAKGMEVGIVNRARQRGDQYMPNASETCPAVIKRQIHDGTALDLYGAELAKQGGTATPRQLLKSISDAVTKGTGDDVPIGGNKSITLNPPGAFDAGYTMGSLDSGVTMQSLGLSDSRANAQKLRSIAEGCLDGDNKQPPAPSACYLAGLALAAQDKHGAAGK